MTAVSGGFKRTVGTWGCGWDYARRVVCIWVSVGAATTTGTDADYDVDDIS